MTPFRALYGREPPTLFRADNNFSQVEEVNVQLQVRDSILEELRANLERAQLQMKQTANKHRRDVSFEEGDAVFLKIQPYKLRSLARKSNEKLSPRYYGPYTILQRIGPVAYKLQLPSEAKIHPVFHVSQLKKSLQPSVQPQPLPTFLTADLELQVQPVAVKQLRTLTNGQTEVLIQWHDLPDHDSTWESYDAILQQFPAFHLEDKVQLIGGGIDGSRPIKTYTRRHKRNVSLGQPDSSGREGVKE